MESMFSTGDQSPFDWEGILEGVEDWLEGRFTVLPFGVSYPRQFSHFNEDDSALLRIYGHNLALIRDGLK